MFFFSSRRRHTRFDCDWSSDVCSSDLSWVIDLMGTETPSPLVSKPKLNLGLRFFVSVFAFFATRFLFGSFPFELTSFSGRSEERRVGKECRSGWSQDH